MRFFFSPPHPAISFAHRTHHGDMRRVVVMRATYRIGPAGEIVAVGAPSKLNFRELSFGGEPGGAPRAESDLAPEKPHVDVIVNADAHAPQGRPARFFEAGLRVRDPAQSERILLQHRLRVCGPRRWSYGRLTGWTLSNPVPVSTVPIRYDRAYGGTARLPPSASDAETGRLLAHPDNPVGRGFIPTAEAVREAFNVGRGEARSYVQRWRDMNETVDAPQLELPGQPYGSPDAPYPFVGWGIVGKHWRPRYRFAGTYDQAWVESRHPVLPIDFDPAYWNGAHPDLQLARLASGAVIELEGVVPSSRSAAQTLRVTLPSLKPRILVRDTAKEGLEELSMRLDTVMVDLLEDQLTLLYRASVVDRTTLLYTRLEVPE